MSQAFALAASSAIELRNAGVSTKEEFSTRSGEAFGVRMSLQALLDSQSGPYLNRNPRGLVRAGTRSSLPRTHEFPFTHGGPRNIQPGD